MTGNTDSASYLNPSQADDGKEFLNAYIVARGIDEKRGTSGRVVSAGNGFITIQHRDGRITRLRLAGLEYIAEVATPEA